jgi:hypothetical protein
MSQQSHLWRALRILQGTFVFHNKREFLENQHDYPEKSPCSQFIKLTSQTTQNKTLSTFTETNQQQETGISGSQLLKTPGRDAGCRAIKKRISTHKHYDTQIYRVRFYQTVGWVAHRRWRILIWRPGVEEGVKMHLLPSLSKKLIINHPVLSNVMTDDNDDIIIIIN